MTNRHERLFPLLALAALMGSLTGCSLTPSVGPVAVQGAAIRGVVHGGQQPVSGAHVYLLAANTTGYGGNGIAASSANASVSLLSAASTGYSDAVGAYVPTAADGTFNISGDYTCTPNTQVYVYALGGNPGSGTNSAAGLMAVLGNCPAADTFVGTISFLTVNEVSTVAAAYALAGFATDATHVSSSGSALALTGIRNAFANAGNLETLATGVALTTTPAGNGVVPQTTINTIANVLAACVNSTGSGSAACNLLFGNIKSAGATGSTATDTATAAMYLAQTPYPGAAQMTNLYTSTAPITAFGPALTAQPTAFTIALQFTGGGLNDPNGIAVDAAGNVFTSNYNNASVGKFSPAGAALSGTGGFTGGGLSHPDGIAVDTAGSVWVVNNSIPGVLSEFNGTTGAAISGTGGYTNALNNPLGVSIDGSGSVWVSNSASLNKFSSSGTAISSTSGYTGGGLTGPYTVAIDGSGAAWASNPNTNVMSKFSNAGAAISGSGGYTGGGLSTPRGVAVDSAGNVWVTNASSLSKFSNAGAAFTGTSGYTGGGLGESYWGGVGIDGAGNVWTSNSSNNSVSKFNGSTGVALSGSSGFTGGGLAQTYGIALDSSGNVWIANQSNSSITEFVGAAAPVITPICAGLPTTPTGNGTSNLGTRP